MIQGSTPYALSQLDPLDAKTVLWMVQTTAKSTDGKWLNAASFGRRIMANRARKYCAVFPCKDLAEPGSSYCAGHKPKPAPKERHAFYGTGRWRKFSEWYRRMHPLCERCEAAGRLVIADMVHHRIPLDQGGAELDPDNVESLCWSCHNKAHGSKNHQAGETRDRAATPTQS